MAKKALPPLAAATKSTPHHGTRASALFARLADEGLRTVPLRSIRPNPDQPRKRFDEAALALLAESIRARGVLQPPVVRVVEDGPGERFELIAGERRWRAAELAELTEIPVLIRNDTDGAHVLEDALMENTAREDLSPIEEARAYAVLIEDLGITREELGRRVGRSRPAISNHLRLLDLPDEALDLLDSGELSFAHGRALLVASDNNVRRRLARAAVSEGWSTRQLEEAARRSLEPERRTVRVRRREAADQQSVADDWSDRASRAVGVDVNVRAVSGDRWTFAVSGYDAARVIAERLGVDAGS